jgi:uncharacterized protein with HEPN domain
MPPSKSFLVPLRYILDELDWMETTYVGMSFEVFTASGLHIRALERSIMIISEAVFRLPENLLVKHPAVDWRSIRGIGNFIRHQYDDVEHRVIWSVLREDALALRPVISEMIKELSA